MRAGIYYNKHYLSENKIYLGIISDKLGASGISCKVVDKFSDLDGLDVLFVLGGDGTILTVAAECARRKVKILGINYGHLGFLAEFEPEKVEDAINLVCSGKFETVKRTMLEISYKDKRFLALNDLVIQRSTSGNGFSNTVCMRADIDGSTVDNFTADGIIISTPTGSTAYSLSAGGSVLSPDVNAFIMTPICAHSLHSRPVVYSDGSVLEIIPAGGSTILNVIADGKIVDKISDSIPVRIQKSEYQVEFITCGDKDFFKKLLIKLNKWSK